MIQKRIDPCGCRHLRDTRTGHETLVLCPADQAIADERHEASRRSGSHVYRNQTQQKELHS